MYLESWLKDSEFVRFQLYLIPPEILEHYNLEQYAVDIRLRKDQYDLKQNRN